LIDAVTDLCDRLISIFVVGPDGRRPCFGPYERMQQDPNWKNNVLFNEYFHGDTGAGLGATHQTGWTGLVADIIRRRHGAVRASGDLLRAADPYRDTGPDAARTSEVLATTTKDSAARASATSAVKP
jgi:hypothetical protein